MKRIEMVTGQRHLVGGGRIGAGLVSRTQKIGGRRRNGIAEILPDLAERALGRPHYVGVVVRRAAVGDFRKSMGGAKDEVAGKRQGDVCSRSGLVQERQNGANAELVARLQRAESQLGDKKTPKRGVK